MQIKTANKINTSDEIQIIEEPYQQNKTRKKVSPKKIKKKNQDEEFEETI